MNLTNTNVYVSGKHLVAGKFKESEDVFYLYVVNTSLTESDFVTIETKEEKLCLVENENPNFVAKISKELNAGCAVLIKINK